MSLRTLSVTLLLGLATTALAQPAPQPAAPAPSAAPSAQPPISQPAPAPMPAPDQTAPAATLPAAPVPAAAEPMAPPAIVEPNAPLPTVELPPPPPPAADGAVEVPPPKKLSIGSEGLFQPGALIQGWYQLDRTDTTTNTLRLRRAEISVKGDIIPSLVSYAIMVDPARALEMQNTVVPAMPDITIKQPPGPVTILQDVFATFQSEYLDVSMGQFKIPVGWESNYSSAKQMFAERSMVSRAFADRRDIGLRLTKTFKYFGYTAGFFNGAGQNNLDTNNGKDGALRLEVYPVEGMTIAVVGYATLWDRKDVGSKDRWEVDARYEHGPFLIQAEYIAARDVLSTGASKGKGFYAALGYYVIDNLQPVIRLGHLDPDMSTNVESDPSMSAGAFKVWSYEAGLTYYILKNEAKLMLNYGRYQYDGAPNNNELIAAVQLWY